MPNLFSFPLYARFERYITINLRNRSDRILRLWSGQCENIIAQRFRRGQQLITLYAKLWEERALKEMLTRFQAQIQRHAKGIMLSAVGLYNYDWDTERISFTSIKTYFNDIDYVKKLKKDTIFCTNCGKRKTIDCKVEGIDYCTCGKDSRTCPMGNDGGHWVPYIERKDMIIWRREEKSGLYAYKVYATYNDVTAEDFFRVQTDVVYRKMWDKTAVSLEVVDSDPVHKGNSHIIYWEMLWPKLFSNRDYVFKRRHFTDRSRKLIVIVSKSTTHPSCPVKPQNQRVLEYWSYMVIKSTAANFKKPGIEFCLTYFDNPGVSMPPPITSWVAQKQMPEFLNKLHLATVKYAERRESESTIFSTWDRVRDPGFEYPPDINLFPDPEDDDDLDGGERNGNGNGNGKENGNLDGNGNINEQINKKLPSIDEQNDFIDGLSSDTLQGTVPKNINSGNEKRSIYSTTNTSCALH